MDAVVPKPGIPDPSSGEFEQPCAELKQCPRGRWQARRASRGASLRGCRYGRKPALAGIIGGRRPWTALMISAVSIPCR